MKIYTDTPEGVTVIQNSFIDQYMPHAGGEYVKVYLYLLRCANSGRELSLSSIADVFEHTEKDVSRALSYWEKQGLLRIQQSGRGELEAITFTGPGAASMSFPERRSSGGFQQQSSGASMGFPGQQSSDASMSFPEQSGGVSMRFPEQQSSAASVSSSEHRRGISARFPEQQTDGVSMILPEHRSGGVSMGFPEQRQKAAGTGSFAEYDTEGGEGKKGQGTPASPDGKLSGRKDTAVTGLSDQEQETLRQLFFIAEQYLQRTLTASEQQDFVYYFRSLEFSADLIEYLIEYCVSKGSVSRHYMRHVALAWAEAGVTTVQQAKRETNLYNRNYFTIMNAFGLKGRNPAPPEQEMMARWLEEYRFPIEIILEACRRTISKLHQPKFEYADRILREWREQKVCSMKDIEALDRKHQMAQAEQKKARKKPENPSSGSAANRFNNFSQREYDYDALEKQLLNQQQG